MKMKCESEVTQSFPTLSDPMYCNLPVLLQARVLEWGAIAFSPCKTNELQIPNPLKCLCDNS